MKILLVSNIFPPGFIGGYELGALDVARGLQSLGHDVRVLTSDYFLDDSSTLEDLEVIRTLSCVSQSHEILAPEIVEGKGLIYNFQNIRTLGSAIRREEPDLLLMFNLHGLGVVSILHFVSCLRIPAVLYLMDNIAQGLDTASKTYQDYTCAVGASSLGSEIKVIAMSQKVVEEVAASLACAPPRATLIPGWVDSNDCRPSRTTAARSGVTRFVFCSRVAPHKGSLLLLDAAHMLAGAGIGSFEVDVYGPGQVGDFMQMTKAMGLDHCVAYRGVAHKNQVPGILARYDALLFPTWDRESFGFIVSEAAASGCLPVFTRGIGAADWFQDGVDCIMIDRNAESLANAMLAILNLDDATLANMRAASRDCASKNFDLRRWMPVIEGICKEAVANSVTRDPARWHGLESGFMVLNSLGGNARQPAA